MDGPVETKVVLFSTDCLLFQLQNSLSVLSRRFIVCSITRRVLAGSTDPLRTPQESEEIKSSNERDVFEVAEALNSSAIVKKKIGRTSNSSVRLHGEYSREFSALAIPR